MSYLVVVSSVDFSLMVVFLWLAVAVVAAVVAAAVFFSGCD